MRLIAKVPGLRSEGKEVPVGGEFDAADRDGVILKKLGKAADAPEKTEVKPKPQAPTPQPSFALSNKQLKAEETIGEEVPSRPRRRYLRRDLVSED